MVNNKKKKGINWTYVFSYALVVGVPLFFGFGAYIIPVFQAGVGLLSLALTNFPSILSFLLLLLSISVMIYSWVRTIVAIAGNKFLPKIPLPQGKTAKAATLVAIGVLIGFVSPLPVLILWAASCVVAMATYSFV